LTAHFELEAGLTAVDFLRNTTRIMCIVQIGYNPAYRDKGTVYCRFLNKVTCTTALHLTCTSGTCSDRSVSSTEQGPLSCQRPAATAPGKRRCRKIQDSIKLIWHVNNNNNKIKNAENGKLLCAHSVCVSR